MILPNGVRRLVELRGDEPKCVLCGREVELTCDHILPKSKGGRNHHSNKVILCVLCNRTKSGMSIEEMSKWYEHRIDFYRHHVKVYEKIKSMLENRDHIVEELRNLYKQGRYREMKKMFYSNLFYLSKEKRDQIFAVVNRLKDEPEKELSEDDKKKGQQLLDFCVNEMGWKVVDE